ncbi:MAG TPA: LysM domain-containing protein [Thermoleophilaceae bacterium]|jgi:LysM repeat protein
MKSRRPRKAAARLFAVLALAAFVIAFLVVLGNSGVTHNSTTTAPPTTSAPTTTNQTTSTSKFAHRRTYVVKSGDTLGAIAIKTGVSVSSLEDLNPGLDPQGLVAGQKLKLRE